MRETNNDVKVV